MFLLLFHVNDWTEKKIQTEKEPCVAYVKQWRFRTDDFFFFFFDASFICFITWSVLFEKKTKNVHELRLKINLHFVRSSRIDTNVWRAKELCVCFSVGVGNSFRHLNSSLKASEWERKKKEKSEIVVYETFICKIGQHFSIIYLIN